MHCIYLHGFASGPSSTKATFYSERLRLLGIDPLIPDLNVPSFEELTISRQLEIVEQMLPQVEGEGALLIGSSLGGLLATLLAVRDPRIVGLILLAPGFGLSRRWQYLWGADALSRWEREGFLEVFHHARKQQARLGFQFMEDARRHNSEDIIISCPALVIHGRSDEVVPVSESLQFKKLNPDLVQLHIVEDDHQMLNSLDDIWDVSVPFIKQLLTSLQPPGPLTKSVTLQRAPDN